MNSLSNQIEAALSAWSALAEAEPESRQRAGAPLIHAVSLLGSRKPITGTALSGDAVTACAARITATLERLQRMAGDPATKPGTVQAVVDELLVDLADWLESFKETNACI